MSEKVVYPVLDLGINREVPHAAYQPQTGAYAWDLVNSLYRRGVLRPAWLWTPLTEIDPILCGHDESRTVAAYARDQAVLDTIFVASPDGPIRAYVTLTDGEIFVNGESKNPTYTTAQTTELPQPGTTSGTVNFSADANLKTRGIKQGDLFQSQKMYDISNLKWESVISVPDDQTLIISRDNYAGDWTSAWDGASAQAYTIRRTFRRDTSLGRAYMHMSNGDLYVACQCAGVDPSGTAKSEWCVLKVSNVLTAPSEAIYILSTWDTTGSLTSKSIVPEIQEITGLFVSTSGRVVISTVEDNVSYNRVRVSANNDESDWQGVGATYYDLQGAKSKIRCLKLLESAGVAYTSDSIFVGVPTGKTAPIFDWEKARGTVGTVHPRTVRDHPYGHIFFGSDGHVYLFDGEMTKQLTSETIRVWTSGVDYEYTLLVPANTVDVLENDGAAAVRFATINPTVAIA